MGDSQPRTEPADEKAWHGGVAKTTATGGTFFNDSASMALTFCGNLNGCRIA